MHLNPLGPFLSNLIPLSGFIKAVTLQGLYLEFIDLCSGEKAFLFLKLNLKIKGRLICRVSLSIPPCSHQDPLVPGAVQTPNKESPMSQSLKCKYKKRYSWLLQTDEGAQGNWKMIGSSHSTSGAQWLSIFLPGSQQAGVLRRCWSSSADVFKDFLQGMGAAWAWRTAHA